MGSLSQTTLVGRVGKDPEITPIGNSGDLVAKFSIATSDRWKDEKSGEPRERVEWHQIVVYDQNAVAVVRDHVKKGGQVGVHGRNETRDWEKDGVKHYRTEVVIRPGRGRIELLDTAAPAAAGPA